MPRLDHLKALLAQRASASPALRGALELPPFLSDEQRLYARRMVEQQAFGDLNSFPYESIALLDAPERFQKSAGARTFSIARSYSEAEIEPETRYDPQRASPARLSRRELDVSV